MSEPDLKVMAILGAMGGYERVPDVTIGPRASVVLIWFFCCSVMVAICTMSI